MQTLTPCLAKNSKIDGLMLTCNILELFLGLLSNLLMCAATIC